MSASRCKLLILAAAFLSLLVLPVLPAAAANRLVVYTYDSFVSWGPAKQIAEGFKARHQVDVVFVGPSSAGEMLARLIGELETGGSDADVFVGLSDTQFAKAAAHNVFLPIDRQKVPNLSAIPKDLQFDPQNRIVPFDHGYITLVYDKRVLKAADVPKTFAELTEPRFAKKIIAIDPRTSSVGHAFLMWTIAHFGEQHFADYWRRLAPNLLTVAGGWSAAYKMFEKGEAPIVVSYATDSAYAVMDGKGDIYGVATLEGAGYRQIEGMGIVRGSKNVEMAHAFINYLLSPEVQALIPTTNWMYPANPQAKLPAEWAQYAKPPARWVRLESDVVAAGEAKWLREWARVIGQ